MKMKSKAKNWFRKLEWELRSLPAADKKPVIDFYKELYAEKREAGRSERFIVEEFGNPTDIANKLKLDVLEKNLEKGERVTIKFGETLSVGRIILFLFLALVLVVPLTAVAVALFVTFWAVIVALAVCFVAFFAAGIMTLVSMFITANLGGLWAAYLGIALVMFGLGGLLVPLIPQMFKASFKASGGMIKGVGRLSRNVKDFMYR